MAIRATYPSGDMHKTAEICLKCGVCCNVAHSCHVMYDEGRFNPRYTFVYDCLASDQRSSNPNIWMCVSCHKCEETCPYEVSPVQFIEHLKGEAISKKAVHPTILAEVTQVVANNLCSPTGQPCRRRMICKA